MRKYFVILFVFLFTFCLSCCAAELENGLVGWWKFDEGKGNVIKDSSGSGNNGEAVKVIWVDGKSGKALSFMETGSYVKIPCRPSLNLGDAITMEACIYPVDISRDSRIIISKNDEYLLRIDRPSEGNKVSAFLHIGTPAVMWEPRISSRTVPETNTWHHVVVTWDGAKMYLYINGETSAIRPRVGKPNPNPYPVMIGNWEYPSCHGTNFGGIIDEVRIYNRALTYEEVRARYRSLFHE